MYVRLRISKPGFTDRCEILHDGSATSQTGFLPFGEDSVRDGRVLGVNRGRMVGFILAEALVSDIPTL